MSIAELVSIIKATDGLVAVCVMIYIGRRIESVQREQWRDVWRLLDKLTNGNHDDES